MSALNGDKSRFNRTRKQKIARRNHTRKLLNRATKEHKSANSPVPTELQPVAA